MAPVWMNVWARDPSVKEFETEVWTAWVVVVGGTVTETWTWMVLLPEEPEEELSDLFGPSVDEVDKVLTPVIVTLSASSCDPRDVIATACRNARFVELLGSSKAEE